ncbi:MAG TPA: MBL fold metallo-hydrolase [Ktedonobacteraceae bacterium]|nr:MBL fold metallo-hydrolase [Ktedonobacteraceae bacterium]
MADRRRFLVRFWGVRGSYPTPGPHTLRHGGNTSCVEVQAGEHTLIFDAGSGIIRLGEELMRRSNGIKQLDLSLFLTHGHSDHLIGFPFFAPLFDARTHLHLFGPQLAGRGVEQVVTPFVSPPYFPVEGDRLPASRAFYTVTDGQCISWNSHRQPLITDGLSIRSQGQNGEPRAKDKTALSADDAEVRVMTLFTHCHPLNGAVVYRVEHAGRSVVYATDVEWGNGCEGAFLAFIEGADLLIHDAQYTASDYQHVKHGYGHSTIEMALEAAMAAHVGELILFHHEPTYDDEQLDQMEAEAQARFARTRSAYEGMEIDLLV